MADPAASVRVAAVAAALTVGAGLPTSMTAQLADPDNSLDVCAGYAMAEMHYVDQTNGDADMDMSFEEGLGSFVTVALNRIGMDADDPYSRLVYEQSLIPLMLPIYSLMQLQDGSDKANAALERLRQACIGVAGQYEETRSVFE